MIPRVRLCFLKNEKTREQKICDERNSLQVESWLDSPSGPPTGFMVFTAGELYEGTTMAHINGTDAGLVHRKETTEGVEEKGGRGQVPPRHVLPCLT